VLLAIGSYTFPWAVGVAGFLPVNPITPEELIVMAANKGLDCVQFGDNMPLHIFPASRLKALKQVADTSNIRLEVGARRLSRENVVNYIAIASELNASFLRMIIDDGDFEPDVAEVMDIIGEILPVLREHHVQLAIENHDRFKAGDLKKIILGTDSDYIGICLDTVNSIGAGESLKETVTMLAPFTFNVHLKDVTIKRLSHKMGFIIEGVEAGKGNIDLAWVIQQVAATGKCRSALVELWLSPEATIEETIIKERQVAEQSIHYIKSLLR
jgi:3-oxoisoapionate decarboxylase